MVFCDPKRYSKVLRSTDPRWRLAVGVHLKKIEQLDGHHMRKLRELVARKDVVALGEIGLDYSGPGVNVEVRQKQRDTLDQVLSLCQPDLVLVLHVRGDRYDLLSENAFKDCLALVKKNCHREQRINLHCFTGGVKEITEWTSSFPNTYFGFTGKVCRLSGPQRLALQRVPGDRLLIETDSPYMAVQPNQSVNTPAYIGEVANLVAGARLETLEAVLRHTTKNGQDLYSQRC